MLNVSHLADSVVSNSKCDIFFQSCVCVITRNRNRSINCYGSLQIADGNQNNVEYKAEEKSKGILECCYKPVNSNRHTVQVNYGGVAVKNSPFRVNVGQPLDASKVHYFGPGVQDGVKPNTPTHFNIDCRYKNILFKLYNVFVLQKIYFRDAGVADLNVQLINEDTFEEVPLKITDNGDKTYTVDYEPVNGGNHILTLHYGGLKVPNTPKKFKVIPNIDVTKIRVDGLEPSKNCFLYYI